MICVCAFEADACLQSVGRVVGGERLRVDGVPAAEFLKNLRAHETAAYWEKVRGDLEKRKNDNLPGSIFTLEIRNDLAVALVHLGQVEEAIAILEELERKSPGQYAVAANLGTAYELNGENRKALEWIKEGVNRKRESHYGTEWLHVKILEAKLAMEQDPDWLKYHSVLETDFGTNEKPAPEIFTTDYLGQKKNLNEIEDALAYQLHERLEFIKPPEPVVADLLVDLSRAFAVLRTPEHAKAVNNLAFEFGAKPKEINKKDAPVDVGANKQAGSNYLLYGILALITALIAGAVYTFIRKRNRL